MYLRILFIEIYSNGILRGKNYNKSSYLRVKSVSRRLILLIRFILNNMIPNLDSNLMCPLENT